LADETRSELSSEEMEERLGKLAEEFADKVDDSVLEAVDEMSYEEEIKDGTKTVSDEGSEESDAMGSDALVKELEEE